MDIFERTKELKQEFAEYLSNLSEADQLTFHNMQVEALQKTLDEFKELMCEKESVNLGTILRNLASDELYILGMVDMGTVNLICLEDGLRWSYGVKSTKIKTIEDVRKHFSPNFEIVRGVDFKKLHQDIKLNSKGVK